MLNNLLREKDKEELIQIIRDLEEKQEGEIIAEFEEVCCPECNSPRCDHNISDVNFSECGECGETFTLHNIKEKRVVIYENLKKENKC